MWSGLVVGAGWSPGHGPDIFRIVSGLRAGKPKERRMAGVCVCVCMSLIPCKRNETRGILLKGGLCICMQSLVFRAGHDREWLARYTRVLVLSSR